MLRPPDLSRRRLPLHVLAPGDRLVRVHTRGREPLFFGPASGAPPIGRWDPPDGGFGTCYFADAKRPYIAFAERFLRDPQRTLIPEAELRRAGVSVVRVEEPIRVVPFHGAFLKRLGTTAAVAHGDHRESRRWAQALWEHEDSPGGVRWRSRIDDDGFAVALFDRSREAVRVVETIPLLEAGGVLDVERCLDRYGAAVIQG